MSDIMYFQKSHVYSVYKNKILPILLLLQIRRPSIQSLFYVTFLFYFIDISFLFNIKVFFVKISNLLLTIDV